MRIGRIGFLCGCLAAFLLPIAHALAADDRDMLALLRNGEAVLLMRHAEAPGTGDPPGFRLDDCATQRNLSAAGHEQARRAGAALRRHGIERAAVYSSAWCRCRDTASGLGLGPVETVVELNSFFGSGDPDGRQTAALRSLVALLAGGLPAILVTHQVNITALTGVYPASGEAILLRRADLVLLGRLKLDVL
jgi:phosphohistidine phosphatase SixA